MSLLLHHKLHCGILQEIRVRLSLMYMAFPVLDWSMMIKNINLKYNLAT